jgi:hypothetical protein
MAELELSDNQLILPDDGGVPILPDSGGSIGGGSTSGAVAVSAERIEEFVTEAGRPLPKFYGRHFIAGQLIVHKFIDNSPSDNESYVAVAIGEGQGNGGGHGELDSAEAVWYAGDPLTANPSPATNPGFRFYNGFISTGVASGPQQVDAYFSSNGLAYSGTGYIAARIPTIYVNAEDRPDKLRGIYKGRRTFNFDATGQKIGASATYSTNPARVAADLILSYYEHKFPIDAAEALHKLQHKIDWEAWKIWHDFNAEEIEWDDGTTVRDIPRFECHEVFTEDASLADALDRICAGCGAFWQDDGKKLIFLPPTEREPVHHFHTGNLLSGIKVEPRDLRNAHNYFTGEYRDQDEEFLGLGSIEVRLEDLVKLAGENKVTHALPSMVQSQAQRLMNLRANLESRNPNIATFVGDASSYRVLPGDYVTVSEPVTGWNYQRCLVRSATLQSAENRPDACQFTVQQIDAPIYSDTAHTARQEALTP